jgi:hypothetical protein
VAITLFVAPGLNPAPRTRLLRTLLRWATQQPECRELLQSFLDVTLVDAAALQRDGSPGQYTSGQPSIYRPAYVGMPSHLFVAYGSNAAEPFATDIWLSSAVRWLVAHSVMVRYSGTDAQPASVVTEIFAGHLVVVERFVGEHAAVLTDPALLDGMARGRSTRQYHALRVTVEPETVDLPPAPVE